MAQISPQRAEFRNGWGILLAATIGTAVAGSHFQILGAMLNALHAAYGWSRGEAALAVTLSTIVKPLVNVPMGIMTDRLGARRVLVPGIFLFGLGLMLLGLAGPSLWSWYVAYVIFTIAHAPATPLVWFSAVVRQFEKTRGLALALALAGSGILTAFVPITVLTLVQNYGVRGTFFALGAIAIGLMLPPALLFIPRQSADEVALSHAQPAGTDRAERREILVNGKFWRLGIAVAMISPSIGTFSVHFQPILTDAGLTPAAAASAAFFTAPGFVLGCLSTGILFDRFSARVVGSLTFMVPALVCTLLLGFNGTFWFASVIAVLIGVGLGAPVNVISFLSGHYFPVKHYGFVIGAMLGILAIAIGIGSWLAGIIFDISGSYLPAFLGFIVASGVAALLVATLGPASRQQPQPAVA